MPYLLTVLTSNDPVPIVWNTIVECRTTSTVQGFDHALKDDRVRMRQVMVVLRTTNAGQRPALPGIQMGRLLLPDPCVTCVSGDPLAALFAV